MPARRLAAAAVLLSVLALAATQLAFSRTDIDGINLSSRQDLPADVLAEVEAVLADLHVASDRSIAQRCDPDVSLLLVSQVTDGDARYVASEKRIEIEIPTSPRRFRDSLVHELAHHLDAHCEDASEMREAWLAQTDEPGQAWTSGDWADRPSEQFAETVVQVVLEERVRHGRSMPLPEFAEELVRTWLQSGSANDAG